MDIKFDFAGGLELEAALGNLTKASTRRAVARKALTAAAEPILEDFKQNTVRATGRLQDSEIIGTRLTRRQARMARRDKSDVELHIGTSDPAGVQQEFGNRHQAAAPALRPAWDAQGGEVALTAISEVSWLEIGKAAGREARRAARLAARGD